jgi:hypothetical protein
LGKIVGDRTSTPTRAIALIIALVGVAKGCCDLAYVWRWGNALIEASSLEVQRWWQPLFAPDPAMDAEKT